VGFDPPRGEVGEEGGPCTGRRFDGGALQQPGEPAPEGDGIAVGRHREGAEFGVAFLQHEGNAPGSEGRPVAFEDGGAGWLELRLQHPEPLQQEDARREPDEVVDAGEFVGC
jgi:hypothetical protein